MDVSKMHTTNASLKWFLLFIAILSIALLSYPAKAETGNQSGTLAIDDLTTTNHTYIGNNIAPTYNNFNMSTMYFYTTGYTDISYAEIFLTSGAWNWAHETNSTCFTIISGGTGSGCASYNKNSKRIYLVFTEGHITSSPVIMSFQQPIYNDITAAGIVEGGDIPALSSTDPIMFAGGATSNRARCNSASDPGCRIISDVSTHVVNNYTVNYTAVQLGTLANVTIDKTGAIAGTKIDVRNSTASKFLESTFNSNSFSFSFVYDTGIALNMSITSGAFDFAVVNSTFYTGPGAPSNAGQAGTNQTVVTKPSSGANVAFDKTSYFVGDNVNISWYLSDSSQNDLLNKKLRLTLNDVPVNTGSLDCGGCVSITQQNGYYIYQATSAGILKADVIEGLVSYNVIGTASVSINPPGASWIAITNTTMYTRTLNNVTYHIGYSVASYPGAAIEMDINDVSNGNLVDVLFPTIFPDGNMTFGQVHPIPVGNFSIRLIDSVKNAVLDTKYFTALPLPQGIPTAGITTSSISVDKSTYFYGDFMQVNYRVDDTNFSNYNYTIMAHVISLDNGNITTKMFITPFEDQVGTFTSIVNIDKTMKCENGLNCWFETGNNSINLGKMNSTAFVTIAYTNFTVSSTTVDGYGLQTSTTTPTSGVQFTATITVPASHTGFFSISNAGTVKSIYVDNQTVNNTALTPLIQTIPETIQSVNSNPVAYYVAELYGDDGRLKVRIPLTVSQVSGIPNPTGWKAPQSDISSSCSYWDGVVTLLFAAQGLSDLTRFEFAILIISLFGLLIGGWTKNFSNGIFASFLPYAFFLYLSLSTPCGTYMPTWTAVFIALILVAKQRWL